MPATVAQTRRHDRRRRIGAHAAGVRPSVAVADALVVLRAGERRRARSVAEREERDLLARQIVFDHHFRAGGAERAGEHRTDRALRLAERHRDDDALSSSQAIRLDDDRRAMRADVGERGGVVAKAAIVAGGHAELPTEILGEAFRAFQPRRRLAGSETENPRRREVVRDARDQGRLGPDDDETDRVRPTEVDDCAVVADVERDVLGDRRAARIPRRDVEFAQQRRLRDRQRESVFACAGAENQDVHCKTLPRSARRAKEVSSSRFEQFRAPRSNLGVREA
jgi:hypothetical protein